MKEIKADILIAGGGSAGFGAAVRACMESNGEHTIVMVDKNPSPGGTSVHAGVTCWEMGIGGPGIHREIAGRLLGKNSKAAVLKGNWKPLVKERPYAVSSPDPKYSYDSTLRAAGVYDRVNNHNSFIFEPAAMSLVMLEILKEASSGNFIFLGNEIIKEARTDGQRILSVTTDKSKILAKVYIDCTGDCILADLAGCKTIVDNNLNGATLVYRVEKSSGAEKFPKRFKAPYEDQVFFKRLDSVRVISSINKYPNGDMNINQLPTMEGDEFFHSDDKEAHEKCLGRVWLHWNRLKKDASEMKGYRIKHIYPMIGIREGRKLSGRYVLNEEDILSGFTKQKMHEEIIAFSDHPVDIHGGDSPGIRILAKPYGIPYDCMVSEDAENLLVAGRGASLTHTAAASCRLSRTMLAMGEAAGISAVRSLITAKSVSHPDISDIRNRLGIPSFSEMLAAEFKL